MMHVPPSSKGPRRTLSLPAAPSGGASSSGARQSPSTSRQAESASGGPRASGVREHEGMLSAYLLARAAMGKKDDAFRTVTHLPAGGRRRAKETPENLVRDLRAANDTLEEARAFLPHGRGNVRSDILATNGEALRRMEAGRNLAENVLKSKGLHRGEERAVDIWVDTAVAGLTGQATCGGSALFTAHLHAPKLEKDQSAIVFHNPTQDHMWTEVVRPGQGFRNDQIIDRWTEGPAVFREDSKYGRDPKGYDYYTLNPGNRDQALHHVGKIADEMKADRTLPRKFASDMRQLQENGRIFRIDVLDPETVLHDRFLEKAGRIMHPRSSKAPGSDKALGTDRKAPVRPYAREILAAGVARSLGEGVKGAADKAPAIVDAARQVFPRRPGKSAPPLQS